MAQLMKIEPVTPADLPSIIKLEQQANAFPWNAAAFASCFSPNYFLFKLQDARATILGYYVGYQVIDQAELFNLCVAPSQQGSGYGAQLLQHFLLQAKQRGATNCLLEVRSTNDRAIALYTKWGFSHYGLRRGYYQSNAGTEDAVLMQCDL